MPIISYHFIMVVKQYVGQRCSHFQNQDFDLAANLVNFIIKAKEIFGGTNLTIQYNLFYNNIEYIYI